VLEAEASSGVESLASLLATIPAAELFLASANKIDLSRKKVERTGSGFEGNLKLM
jgi:hypothetical protein